MAHDLVVSDWYLKHIAELALAESERQEAYLQDYLDLLRETASKAFVEGAVAEGLLCMAQLAVKHLLVLDELGDYFSRLITQYLEELDELDQFLF